MDVLKQFLCLLFCTFNFSQFFAQKRTFHESKYQKIMFGSLWGFVLYKKKLKSISSTSSFGRPETPTQRGEKIKANANKIDYKFWTVWLGKEFMLFGFRPDCITDESERKLVKLQELTLGTPPKNTSELVFMLPKIKLRWVSSLKMSESKRVIW